jgi:hypothetical protein
MTEVNPYETAELLLCLTYGDMERAYQAWCKMSLSEQRAFDSTQYEVLMRYEYYRQFGRGKYS